MNKHFSFLDTSNHTGNLIDSVGFLSVVLTSIGFYFRCTGYLDTETDTNSIDRSIAHLLFHRPSNSSVMADSLALESPSTVGVSAYASKNFMFNTLYLKHTLQLVNEQIFETLLSPPMIDENLISAGENAAEPDKGTKY